MPFRRQELLESSGRERSVRVVADPGRGPMNREPGTTCKLYYDTPVEVIEGDFIRTRRGSCYRVDRAVRRGHRWYLDVTRLELDAVAEGEAGVHELVWYRRQRV